jgi:TonB family protein
MITLIVEAALRSLALGAVVALALAAIRPRNPHLHKTIWSTVLLASFAMPLLIGSSVAPEIPAPTYVLTTLQSGAAPIARAPTHWLQIAGILYAAATVALLARFAIGWIQMWRIRRRATVLHERWTRSDDVRVSLQLRTPATFGSTILLPPEFCEWSERKFAAVMAHERSHVRHGDCYLLWLARIHTCLFWISPLAWWLQSRLAALAETTSDDAAIAELGDRPAYAELLLEIAAASPDERSLLSAAEMASSHVNIAARIERIISGIAPAAAPKRRYQLLAVALVLPVAVVSAATLQLSPLRLAQADAPSQADDDDPLRPRLISGGDPAETQDFYPAMAKARGLDGMVRVAIDLDAEGVPTGAHVVDETPVDLGFGDAATTIVQTFRFSNPRHLPTQIKLAVKFELKRNAPADLPPPQSPVGG